jgi:hypothetical protein
MNLFKINTNILIFLVGYAAISCGSNAGKTEEVANELANLENPYQTDMPAALQEGIEAIGGIEKWNQFGTLSYDLKSSWSEDHQVIDLKNRYVSLSSEKFKAGFDGDEVWVTPSLDSLPNARFYSSLFFYFVSIPYVLNDDGIIYEDLGKKELNGNTYHAVKVSYTEGVGDAYEDQYIVHFNPQNQEMEWLLYTVTYGGRENVTFSALNYLDWQDINGIKIPTRLQGYKYEADTIGDPRYEAVFTNLSLSEDRPDPSLFVMPEGADIDTLKSY